MARKRELGFRHRLAWRMVTEHSDIVAEALIAHVDCCTMRETALRVLRDAGLTELEFLSRWSRGELGG